MLLADEFFLLAHDDTTGKPKLHARAVGLGLAGCLLAELVLCQRITVRAAAVSVLDRRPPSDALAHTVLDQLINEPEHQSVRVWLSYLGQNAHGLVGERLARAGMVRRQESRRLLRSTTTYVPVDINAAAWPATRLRSLFDHVESMSLPDAVLVGLVAATGLDRKVLWQSASAIPKYLGHVIASLPPPTQELVTHTEAAVGAAVLSARQ
ncbi:MAG TPA: GPP34 family phosphoprotein [Micromonosporaceae bacterium]|nr:GPP34 family phosphoprotein [Micromonosporaceae bacterium]